MASLPPPLLLALCLLPACAYAPPSAAAAALQAALDAAIAARAPAFALPAGADIFFNDASLNISGAASISIDGGNSTLYFAPGAGVMLESCTGVALRNLAIDYVPLPYVHGTVTAANASTTTVRLDDASLTFEALLQQYPPHDIWPPPSAFDGATGDYRGTVCRWGAPAPAREIAPREYAVACGGAAARVGDVFVAATRVGVTLSLSRTAAVTVTDVTIHAAGYMAITEFLGGGGNVYERVRLVPRNASRPLASNADGFHSSGMRAGPTLRGVEIRNLLDDYFNVHNTFQLVVAVESPTRVLLGDFQLFPGGNTLYGTQRTLDAAAAGDALSFFPINTFTYPAAATQRIADVALVAGADAAAALARAYAAAAAAAAATPCSACHRGLNAFASAQLYNVTLTGPLPPLPSPALVNLDALSNAGARIEGCAFSGSASNTGRFKSSGGVIAGSSWRLTQSQNLEIAPLQNWLEGMLGIHNISIRDNVFYGTRESPVKVFGATNVSQANNTFIPTGLM